MDPEQLAQFLNTVAQLLTDGGTHVYDAARQSVIVGIQRDIALMWAGVVVSIIGVIGCAILASIPYKRNSYSGDTEVYRYDEWHIGTAVCLSALIVVGFALASRIFDYQRVDYLTLWALRWLVP
jgi:hypothetical protein